MRYLSGAIRPELFATPGLGWLVTPNMGNRVPAGETWAAVVGDAAATLVRSLPMLAKIRELGYPAALVAQDGLGETTPVPWDAFDVLFIGGSTDWKMGPAAAALIVEAKARGKRVHVGRVNSGRRFRHFAELGADTADGTFLAFGPAKNAPRLLGWLADEAHRIAQLTLDVFDRYRDDAGIDELVGMEFAR